MTIYIFVLIRLNLKGNSEVYSLGICLDEECWRVYEQDVHSLLNQGLTDRAKFIRVIWRNTYSDFNVENVQNLLLTNFNF